MLFFLRKKYSPLSAIFLSAVLTSVFLPSALALCTEVGGNESECSCYNEIDSTVETAFNELNTALSEMKSNAKYEKQSEHAENIKEKIKSMYRQLLFKSLERNESGLVSERNVVEQAYLKKLLNVLNDIQSIIDQRCNKRNFYDQKQALYVAGTMHMHLAYSLHSLAAGLHPPEQSPLSLEVLFSTMDKCSVQQRKHVVAKNSVKYYTIEYGIKNQSVSDAVDALVDDMRTFLSTEAGLYSWVSYRGAEQLAGYLNGLGIEHVVDPMAGGGYVGWLLSSFGLRIDACDVNPVFPMMEVIKADCHAWLPEVAVSEKSVLLIASPPPFVNVQDIGRGGAVYILEFLTWLINTWRSKGGGSVLLWSEMREANKLISEDFHPHMKPLLKEELSKIVSDLGIRSASMYYIDFQHSANN